MKIKLHRSGCVLGWLALAVVCCPGTSPALKLVQLTDELEHTKSWCSEPAWSPDATRIVYVRGSFSAAHDDFESELEIVSLADERPRRVGAQTKATEAMLCTHPSWSPDGGRIAFSTQVALHILELQSNELQTVTEEHGGEVSPVWSPDGNRIAFQSALRGILDIWVLDLDTGSATRLTGGSSVDRSPVWSPDGSKIAYESNRSGNFDIWIQPSTGGYPRQITNDPGDDTHPTWSPDGEMIAFSSTRSGNTDVWIVPARGGQATQLTMDPAEDIDPSWSPDGGRIAFASTRSGELHIWVASELPPRKLFLRSWQSSADPLH